MQFDLFVETCKYLKEFGTLATRMAPPGGKGLLMICDYGADLRAEPGLLKED